MLIKWKKYHNVRTCPKLVEKSSREAKSTPPHTYCTKTKETMRLDTCSTSVLWFVMKGTKLLFFEPIFITIYHFSSQYSCVELFIVKINCHWKKCFIHLVIIIQILDIQNCMLNFYETLKGYLYIEKTAILLREFASWEIKEDLG